MKELSWMQAAMEFLFGVKYTHFVNYGTKEIHVLEDSDSKCRLNMVEHGDYITKKKALKLLNKGYNGCRYCWKEKDKG